MALDEHGGGAGVIGRDAGLRAAEAVELRDLEVDVVLPADAAALGDDRGTLGAPVEKIAVADRRALGCVAGLDLGGEPAEAVVNCLRGGAVRGRDGDRMAVRGVPGRGGDEGAVVQHEALLHGKQARGVVAALERAALGVADAGGVAVRVVGLAQRREPIVAVGPGLGARHQAAAGHLSEREALFGLAVVVGAGRRDLYAVAVGHNDFGGGVAGAVGVERLGVGGRGDALVAGEVGPGFWVDAAQGALLEDVAGVVVVPFGAHAGSRVLGAAFQVKGVRGDPPRRTDTQGEGLGYERVDLADEGAVEVGGCLLEELKTESLLVAAEVVAARGDRRAAVLVAVAGVGVLREAAQLATYGVVPAVARVIMGGPRPFGAVGFGGGHQHRRGRGRGAGPGRTGGLVGGGELRRRLVRHGHAVAEAIFLRLQKAGTLHHRREIAPGLRAVGVDAQEVDGAAAVYVAQDHNLVGLEFGPRVDVGRGVGAVELIDPQADVAVADADEVRGAVSVDVGELPAFGLRHFGDADHFGRVLEEAEAGARGHEDAALARQNAHEVREAVAVHVGELHARLAQAQAGGRRRDSLGGVKSRAVPALQPDPAVAVVVAQNVDPAVEI